MSSKMRASSLYRYLIGFIFVFLIASYVQARIQPSLDNDLQRKVSDILNARSLRKEEVSVVVRSLKSNKNVYEKNAKLLLNPASNVKIITTLAALHYLKPEFRFKTDYMLDGQNLLVKGFGDPSVTTDRLRDVAHQLKLRGVSEIVGDLVLDESYFDDQHYAKGQDKEINNTKAWAAPESALSLNLNTFEVFVRPTHSGSAAFVSIEPQSDYFERVGEIKTTSKGFRPVVSVSSGAQKTTVQLSGFVSERLKSKSFFRRVSDPSSYFGATFRQLLLNEGIKVAGKIRRGVASPEAKSVYVDQSPRLTDIVNETNKLSCNFMAEMLVKAIGATVKTPATFDDGLLQIRKFLEEQVGFKKGEYSLGNGSGLNLANQFSASQFVRVLEYAAKDFELAPEFISSLSVAGTQGTLARRMREPSMQRRLRAKTGTLAGVSSLSGYIAGQNDDTLMFAIMFNGRGISAYSLRKIQDDISRKLAKRISLVNDKEVVQTDENESDELGENDSETDSMAGGG